jgi:hypothetical protein
LKSSGEAPISWRGGGFFSILKDNSRTLDPSQDCHDLRGTAGARNGKHTREGEEYGVVLSGKIGGDSKEERLTTNPKDGIHLKGSGLY